MKTDLIVSCPRCEQETTVTMEMENHGFGSLLSMLVPTTKTYTFGGHKKCACGNTVVVTLSVTCGEAVEK